MGRWMFRPKLAILTTTGLTKSSEFGHQCSALGKKVKIDEKTETPRRMRLTEGSSPLTVS